MSGRFGRSRITFSGTTALLPGGSYTVSANYPGDSTFSGSASSPAIPITVTPEGSKTSVSVITQNSQGVVSTFTSGPYGSAPLYARVDVVGNSGNGFPSGSLTLLDNGQPINGGLTLPLNSQGNALPTNPIFTFPAGSHSLTATYTGDASFNSSSSTAPATFTITHASVNLSASGNTTIALGSTTRIYASFSATSCGNPPAGTITFMDGATVLGTPQPLMATALPNCEVTFSATLNTDAFTLGNNSISLKYSGDANYTPATTQTFVIDAQIYTTMTLSSSNPSVKQGESVTFTSVVSPNQNGGPGPTGFVTFTASQELPGGGLGSVKLVNGQAQITLNSFVPGTITIFAQYSGDTDYAPSASSFVEQISPGPDFSISFSPSTLNVASPGASATTMVSVTGSNGFNTPISFAGVTCAGLPSESSCSFSQMSISPGSSTTLTIATTAPSILTPSNRPSAPPSANAVRFILLAFASALFAFQFRRRQLRWLAPALLFSLLLVNSACGGGGSTGPANPGTPQVKNQTITIAVTSGSITHNFTFILNVN